MLRCRIVRVGPPCLAMSTRPIRPGLSLMDQSSCDVKYSAIPYQQLSKVGQATCLTEKHTLSGRTCHVLQIVLTTETYDLSKFTQWRLRIDCDGQRKQKQQDPGREGLL